MINNMKKMLLGIMISSATIVPLVLITSSNVVLVDNNYDSGTSKSVKDFENLNSLSQEVDLINSINTISPTKDLDNNQNSLLDDELKLIINYDLEPIENENAELLKTKVIKQHSKFF
ncbi:MAG: hypothetical protein ACRDCH_00055 [Metamycoplasmataceae bacterium]